MQVKTSSDIKWTLVSYEKNSLSAGLNTMISNLQPVFHIDLPIEWAWIFKLLSTISGAVTSISNFPFSSVSDLSVIDISFFFQLWIIIRLLLIGLVIPFE